MSESAVGAFSRHRVLPPPRPRILYLPAVGSGEGYSWRHYAAYGHLGKPPFRDALGALLGVAQTDESEKKEAELLQQLGLCALKIFEQPSMKDLDRDAAASLQGCPALRRAPGFNIFGAGQPLAAAFRSVLKYISEETNCEEINWITVRPDPIIYIEGQPFATADRDTGEVPDYPPIPGWRFHRTENDLARLKKDQIRDADFKLDYILESYHDIPEKRVREIRQGLKVSDLGAITTLRKTLHDLRGEGYIVNDLRVPFAGQTPSVDDLDELVGMIKGKGRFAAFVFSSPLGRGRSTVGMVAAAMIRHVILGKGNFGPITYDAVEIPERYPGKTLMKVILEKLPPCPGRLDMIKIASDPKTAAPAFDDVSVVFVVASPGSGKSGLCSRLASRFSNVAHIAVGKLLREKTAAMLAASKPSANGGGNPSQLALAEEIRSRMKVGVLVADEIVFLFLFDEMTRLRGQGSRYFLLEGFPRTRLQAERFEKFVRRDGVRCCVCVDATAEAKLKRLRDKWLLAASAADERVLPQREDEEEPTALDRIETFEKTKGEVEQFYRETTSQSKWVRVQSWSKLEAAVKEDEESTNRELTDLEVFEAVVDGLRPFLLRGLAVIFVVGGPGCGKGTQCDRLKETFSLKHISSGDLLRDEVASGSELGRKLQETMTKGELVSMKTVLGMIAAEMIDATLKGFKGFLIDGYPREEAQGVLFEESIHPCKICIYFRASDETMLTRMMKRAETSGRADDNEETMKARLATFHKHSQPVVDYYKKHDKLIEIDAEKSTDDVFAATVEGMRQMLFRNVFVTFVVGGPGCGKGTQCDRLKTTFDLTHISSGDLLRDEVTAGTKLGKMLKETMERGELVAMETVLEMLKIAMLRATLRGSRGFLIDGYPREEKQGVAFEESVCPANVCLSFKASDETMLKRMRKRGETSGRSDDNEFTMRERLKTFRKHSNPVVNSFRNAGKLIEVDAEAATEVVFAETIDELRKFLLKNAWICFVIGAPGSGRTTQCRKLAEALKAAHISWERIMLAEIDSGTELGKRLEKKRMKGIAIERQLALTMIKSKIMKVAMGGFKGFLIDGCPSDQVGAEIFKAEIRPCEVCVYLNAADAALMRRLEVKHGEAEADAAWEAVKTHRRHIQPVLEEFKKRDRLLKIECGVDDGADEVFEKVVAALKTKMLARIKVLFVVGGPGCGKGTQCDRMKTTFGLKHISSGDLLRDEVASGSDLGQKLKAIMVRGELVPMKVVLFMIQTAMMEAVIRGYKGFLIDGYPREREQGILFEKEIHPCSVCLYFKASDETMLSRMRKRAETSGRDDDNEETMKSRLATFHAHSEPVLEYYGKMGKLVQVDAEEAPSVVYDKAVQQMKDMLLEDTAVIFVVGGPGSGKGTQCDRLKVFYEFDHISSGDLLRDEVASGSELGRELAEIMKRGELVPMETVLNMIRDKMIKGAVNGAKGFLIDGYPRQVKQGVAFEERIRPCRVCLYFNVSAPTMMTRMKGRALTSGRADDADEAIMKERVKTFFDHFQPILEHYRKEGKLVEVHAEDIADYIFHRAITDVKNLVLKESRNIFVIGISGSGKTTLCKRIAEAYGIKHISTGELIDKEIKMETTLGKHVEELVSKGQLVPNSDIFSIVSTTMVKAALRGHNAFILDGFPREEKQGLAFEDQIWRCQLCLHCSVEEETAMRRRREWAARNGVHLTEEALAEDMSTFKRNSPSIITQYRKTGRLVEINAEEEFEAVFRRAASAMQLSLFKNLRVVFIVGGPGSGKGTQCDRLKRTLNFTHISSGDLLRDEVARETPRGKEMLEIMKKGELVPMATVLEMIRDAMMKAVLKDAKGFLIDGYPREEEQGIKFEEEIHNCQLCISYGVSDDTMLSRMRARAETSGRADDNEETMLERIKTFHKHAVPVLSRYRNLGKIAEIAAEGAADQVFQYTMDALKKSVLRHILVIFVVGGPGCGKGTQCERLRETYQLTHISSGDLLRDEVSAGSDLGREVEEIMTRGELVPLETVLAMIRNAMMKAVLNGTRGFLIDGYPRERAQGIQFEAELHPCHACVYFNVSDEIMLKRMRKRAETSGRADDNEVTMQARLDTFRRHSDPVVGYFRTAQKLVEIDASDPPEIVYDATIEALANMGIHPSEGRVSDNNLMAVDEMLHTFKDPRQGKKLLDVCIDACGPPPEGNGLMSLRDVIWLYRDRYVNGDPAQKRHWLEKGRHALKRYLRLLCFAIYLRANVSNKFDLSFKHFQKPHYQEIIDRRVREFQFN